MPFYAFSCITVEAIYICVGTICCNALKCLLQRLLDDLLTDPGNFSYTKEQSRHLCAEILSSEG